MKQDPTPNQKLNQKPNQKPNPKLKLGLIGDPLAHSWSPEIHAYLLGNMPGQASDEADGADRTDRAIQADYSLWQLGPDELDGFFAARDFDGINVTIPYKTDVIRYLDEIDDAARRIGAVNCIVNRSGRLTGYNTDAAGLALMADRNGINESSGPAIILGSGGASRAAAELCRQKGWDYRIASRDPAKAAASYGQNHFISYEEMYAAHDRWSLLINATPVGMHPCVDGMPAEISRLDGLESVIDIVANPVRSRLVFEAQQLGLRVCGGLEMLVAQALISDELFTGRSMDGSLVDGCVRALLRAKRNIVLTGMPSAGKSTIAGILARRLGMDAIDMDARLEEEMGMPVAGIFGSYGEAAFRDAETRLCEELKLRGHCVISTGGGVVTREENMRRLSHNGVVVWIDRDVRLLEVTDTRPLAASSADLERLYRERRLLYERYSDLHITNNAGADEAADSIISALGLKAQQRKGRDVTR